MPSQENIDRICRDCKAQLYDNYYFNFITPIPRAMLEQLAKAAVETNTVAQISKVGRVRGGRGREGGEGGGGREGGREGGGR